MPCLNTRNKIIPRAGLPEWRAEMRRKGIRLVVTNGCFDLLHAGHVAYLEAARSLGDALLLGLNGDAGVRELKGDGRPINVEEDRAVVLAALEAVTAVSIFPEPKAIRFLETAQPDIYVKGGDYTLETLNQQERAAVEGCGGQIRLIPFVAGKSTTGLVKKILGL